MMRVSVAVEKDEWVFGFPQAAVSVGAAPEANLVLADERVAPQHAMFELQGATIWIAAIDRPSVMVNGVPVARGPLREGDEIEIGPYRLAVLGEDPPAKTEQDFRDAIARSPLDDAPRAVYGDWLEENGRHEHARFLRAQLEIRGLVPGSARFRELSATIMTLAPNMTLAFRQAIARPAIENCGVKFELSCPKTWDSLESTGEADTRYCNACQKNVYFAPNLQAAQRLPRDGRCVSVDIAVPRSPGDLHPPPTPPMRLGGMIAPRPTFRGPRPT